MAQETAHHGAARAEPPARQKRGRYRHCSGCARETEHVAWASDGRASIPSIRWPAAEPASGTTICLNCGQWRAAAAQAGLTAWSSRPIATRKLAIVADDAVSEAAAENEGVPPKREPQPARAA